MAGLFHTNLRGPYMAHGKAFLFSVVLMSFPLFALAAEGTIGDIDDFQKQRVLYEAKAAANKAKAAAEGFDSTSGVALGVRPNAAAGVNGQANIATVDTVPRLVKINGRRAIISLANGNTTSVESGQLLPGGQWLIMSIGLDGVKIKNTATQSIQMLN